MLVSRLDICAGPFCAKTFYMGTFRNLTSVSAPEPFAPEPSASELGTFRNLTSGICTGTFYYPLNIWAGTSTTPPNIRTPHLGCALEPSGTSPRLCAGTLWNLMALHRNPRQLHQALLRNLPTFWNLTSVAVPKNLLYPPEPFPEPGVEAAPDRTGAKQG